MWNNAYQEGFFHGYQDGINNKPKNPKKHIPLPKVIISKNALNTYFKGYNEGYRKGQHDSK